MNDMEARLAALEADHKRTHDELSQAKAQIARTKTRLNTLYGLATLGVVTAFTLGFYKESIAQGYTMTLAQAAARITTLETKTASISTLNDPNGNPVVRFSNVNVQIVDGSGTTDGATNGRGNLIVGYNERDRDSGATRTGSHNLIVGVYHNYSSFSGIMGGVYNTITAPYASITGGQGNTAVAESSTITGGINNIASGNYASVSGGQFNTALGRSSTVSGGSERIAFPTASWVAGSLFEAN